MRDSRLLWGGLVALLLVALIATFFLSTGAVSDAEAEAARRAEDYTNTVLFNNLTPELVSEPILGPDYRDLIIAVQAGILSDDRVARVRIWTNDGLLVFSTDQRDKQGEYTAADNAQIQAAAGGTTVSLPTQATVAPRSGLAGSDEKLYQTFVPLRLLNQLGISGVSQIDQHYSAIEADANAVWQPLQIGLIAALVIVAALFVVSLRKKPAPARVEAAAGTAVASPSSAGDAEWQDRVRLAEEEARAAQLRADKAEELLARAEERAARAEAVVKDGQTEQATGEVQRLRSALAERDAQLALAQEAGTSGEEETAKVLELVEEQKAKAAEAEALATQAAKVAVEAEQRAAEAESKLGAVEAARIAAEAAVVTAASGEEAKTSKALRAAQLQMNELKGRLTETEAALSVARAKLAEREQADAALEAQRVAVSKELEVAKAAASKEAAAELEAVKKELVASDASLAAAEQAREALAAELERTKADSAKAATAAGSADGLAVEVAALRTQVAELEDRRRTDVSELQRAQEALANTQVEATQAKRRTKELEERVRELESEPVPAAPPVPAPFTVAEPAGYEEVPSFSARLVSLVHQREAHAEPEPAYVEPEIPPGPRPEPAAEPIPEPPVAAPARAPQEERAVEPKPKRAPAAKEETEPSAAEGEDEGLSLRTRLARAAAARHRPPGMGSPDDS